jgi:membrane associated rhomboid family serine protease
MRREYWHLTEGLIFAHFAVFLLSYSNPEGLRALALFPGQVAARPWSLVTYQFIHGTSMFWFFISMLILWIMAKPLEDSWGSPRFLVFWLIATFGASIAAALLGISLAGDQAVSGSILFTFATLYPETEFRLFFIIPVKVKYLAIIAGAFLVFSGLSLGLGAGIAYVAGMSAGYLFFLATRRLPTRRKLAFQLKKRKAEVALKVEDTTAAQRNLAWDPRLREAEARARELGAVAEQDEPFLAELETARDPSITVCAPDDFGYVDDDVCKTCTGFAECAARRIRMAAEERAAES